jgi:hypothetical protein
VKNPVVSWRSKHIDVLHFFVRERSDRGEIVFEYCGTERMVADSLKWWETDSLTGAGRVWELCCVRLV